MAQTETHYCGACRDWSITVPLGQARQALEALDAHTWTCRPYQRGEIAPG